MRDHRPRGLSVKRGCELMEISRSCFYAEAELMPTEVVIIDEIKAICATSPAYGYRRVDAELRHRGFVVNSKKVRRIMREQGLQPKRKRRFVATTDSNHDGPIFPNIAKGFEIHAPDHLWVADITYVELASGFAYLAVIMDAWSRRIVGYALDRKIDARLVTAALKAATAFRRPLPGTVFHSDRGSVYA
ncbi:MAG: IS3 family transposase [Pseudomonadota bacterium]